MTNLRDIMTDCKRCGGQFDSTQFDECQGCKKSETIAKLEILQAVRNRQTWTDDKTDRHSKYHREIKPGVFVDVYDVLSAWGVTNPALQHLIKKALQPGQRGHKTRSQDMDDIVASAERAREIEI